MQQLMAELMEAMIKMMMGVVVVVVTNELGKHTHTLMKHYKIRRRTVGKDEERGESVSRAGWVDDGLVVVVEVCADQATPNVKPLSYVQRVCLCV
ncbi:MAG: hypothetical protein QWI73_06710 [Alphaproteobacteria bacterium]|nr:hypothetical protein [Alphaproteobacteria bacterium]